VKPFDQIEIVHSVNATHVQISLEKALIRFPSVILLTILMASSASVAAQTREVIIYGQNTPAWNQKIGVTGTRGTCNLAPVKCIQTVKTILDEQHTSRFYLNLVADPKTVADYAALYSRASLSEHRLYEITLDDFPEHFNTWSRMPGVTADALLGQVIDRTKSVNPNLKFGVTIYEDQIDSLLANPRFVASLRNRIDTIHLYVHFRADGPLFEAYVLRIKQNFPFSSVIAGSYPYDRIDYWACAPSSRAHCTSAQELDLYKQTLKIQVRLLEQGVVRAIEFYPAFFGMEEKYGGWSDPRQCSPERKQICIDNTKTLHLEVLQTLQVIR
jgi:hypothetical protein